MLDFYVSITIGCNKNRDCCVICREMQNSTGFKTNIALELQY